MGQKVKAKIEIEEAEVPLRKIRRRVIRLDYAHMTRITDKNKAFVEYKITSIDKEDFENVRQGEYGGFYGYYKDVVIKYDSDFRDVVIERTPIKRSEPLYCQYGLLGSERIKKTQEKIAAVKERGYAFESEVTRYFLQDYELGRIKPSVKHVQVEGELKLAFGLETLTAEGERETMVTNQKYTITLNM